MVHRRYGRGQAGEHWAYLVNHPPPCSPPARDRNGDAPSPPRAPRRLGWWPPQRWPPAAWFPWAAAGHKFGQRLHTALTIVQCPERRQPAALRRGVQPHVIPRRIAPNYRLQFAAATLVKGWPATEDHGAATLVDVLIQQIRCSAIAGQQRIHRPAQDDHIVCREFIQRPRRMQLAGGRGFADGANPVRAIG